MLTSAPRLSAGDCTSRVRSGEALLVDVREASEWTAGVARSARLLPLSDLTGSRTAWRKFLLDADRREILLYCAVGGRAGIAARILSAEGFQAANTGGIKDWIDAGWPVVKP
jgi:rhodanese-related sulfurtransferase